MMSLNWNYSKLLILGIVTTLAAGVPLTLTFDENANTENEQHTGQEEIDLKGMQGPVISNENIEVSSPEDSGDQLRLLGSKRAEERELELTRNQNSEPKAESEVHNPNTPKAEAEEHESSYAIDGGSRPIDEMRRRLTDAIHERNSYISTSPKHESKSQNWETMSSKKLNPDIISTSGPSGWNTRPRNEPYLANREETPTKITDMQETISQRDLEDSQRALVYSQGELENSQRALEKSQYELESSQRELESMRKLRDYNAFKQRTEGNEPITSLETEGKVGPCNYPGCLEHLLNNPVEEYGGGVPHWVFQDQILSEKESRNSADGRRIDNGQGYGQFNNFNTEPLKQSQNLYGIVGPDLDYDDSRTESVGNQYESAPPSAYESKFPTPTLHPGTNDASTLGQDENRRYKSFSFNSDYYKKPVQNSDVPARQFTPDHILQARGPPFNIPNFKGENSNDYRPNYDLNPELENSFEVGNEQPRGVPSFRKFTNVPNLPPAFDENRPSPFPVYDHGYFHPRLPNLKRYESNYQRRPRFQLVEDTDDIRAGPRNIPNDYDQRMYEKIMTDQLKRRMFQPIPQIEARRLPVENPNAEVPFREYFDGIDSTEDYAADPNAFLNEDNYYLAKEPPQFKPSRLRHRNLRY